MTMQRIKFKGEEYLLVDNSITTIERYKSGTVSYARIRDDGIVMRYQEKIGDKEDIEFLEEIEDIEMTPDGIRDMLLGKSWFSGPGEGCR